MEDKEADVRAVSRKEARSGRVSYSQPTILYESSKSRIVVVPFYIRKSEGEELAVKIETQRKGPLDWNGVLRDDKSVSLDGEATRRLLKALKEYLAVSEQEDGDYLLVRVSEGTAQLEEHDPAQIAGALTKVLSQHEIVQHLGDMELGEELTRALRGAIRLSEMRTAVVELRQQLDSGEDDERIYQAWCNKHSWAFGNAYVMRDEVRNISAGDSLDLLLPNVISGYRDIVELKRPSMEVLLYDGSHRNYYFSSDVSKAIGQTHRYLDVLHEAAANGLRDHPEIVAYHPRAIIVIGRSKDWELDKLKALHGLNSRLSRMAVMTYDQLLAQGERLVEVFAAGEQTASPEEDESFSDVDSSEAPVDEDDIPF